MQYLCSLKSLIAKISIEMTDKQMTGQSGEALAKQFLLDHGYTILETNWRFGHLEVDVIALKDDTLVFVEVKTRASGSLSAPELSVNMQKQRNIIRAANSYVVRNQYSYDVRFDIITVVTTPQGPQLEHIADAYKPRW